MAKGKVKKGKLLSTGHLDNLWSEAVKIYWGRCCALCLESKPVEAHHIIPRRHFVTRWMIENGLPVCHGCHAKAHGYRMVDRIKTRIGLGRWEELCRLEGLTLKEYLAETGQTKAEFRKEKAKELRDIINGNTHR